MKPYTRVNEVVKALKHLHGLAEARKDVRHGIRTQLEQLALIRDDPHGQIEVAVRILGEARDMSLGDFNHVEAERGPAFSSAGERKLTEATNHLKLWLAEQPDTPRNRFSTEAEQIVNAGDVSRRIQGGLNEVSLRTGAGAIGGGEIWVDVD